MKAIIITLSALILTACVHQPAVEKEEENGWEINQHDLQEFESLMDESNSSQAKSIDEWIKARRRIDKRLKEHIDTVSKNEIAVYFTLRGELEDFYRVYDFDENLREEREYRNGKEIGLRSYYDKYGDLTEERQYFTTDNGEQLEDFWIYSDGAIDRKNSRYISVSFLNNPGGQKAVGVLLEGLIEDFNQITIQLDYFGESGKILTEKDMKRHNAFQMNIKESVNWSNILLTVDACNLDDNDRLLECFQFHRYIFPEDLNELHL